MHVNKYAKRYLNYKKQVAWVARSEYREKPTKEPVRVNLKLYLSGGNQGDIDNYFKSITDSLNKIVYEDDRQVQVMAAEKIECEKTNDRAVVEVSTANETITS